MAQSLRSFCKSVNTPWGTACCWICEWEQLGSKAYQHTCKMSHHLGRKSRVSNETLRMLVLPSCNPMQDQLYEAQIAYFNIPIQQHQLWQHLKQSTYGGQMFKQAFVRKILSQRNCQLWVAYVKEHKGQTVDDFWQYVYFTNEAHIDPSSMVQGFILRELGHHYDTENIQEHGDKTGVKLYIAAWINWHKRADRLQFYNDEKVHTKRPQREAELPHERIDKPRGNSMTQTCGGHNTWYTKIAEPSKPSSSPCRNSQILRNWAQING